MANVTTIVKSDSTLGKSAKRKGAQNGAKPIVKPKVDKPKVQSKAKPKAKRVSVNLPTLTYSPLPTSGSLSDAQRDTLYSQSTLATIAHTIAIKALKMDRAFVSFSAKTVARELSKLSAQKFLGALNAYDKSKRVAWAKRASAGNPVADDTMARHDLEMIYAKSYAGIIGKIMSNTLDALGASGDSLKYAPSANVENMGNQDRAKTVARWANIVDTNTRAKANGQYVELA